MSLSELAMDIASIPDLAMLPQRIVKLGEDQLGEIEQDDEKIEVEFGKGVVSIFHKNCPYLATQDGIKKGWHYQLTTYYKDGRPAAGGIVAEVTAIDQIVQYLREQRVKFSCAD